MMKTTSRLAKTIDSSLPYDKLESSSSITRSSSSAHDLGRALSFDSAPISVQVWFERKLSNLHLCAITSCLLEASQLSTQVTSVRQMILVNFWTN